MPVVSQKRWRAVIEALRLDSKLEFGSGDVGVTGGIQIFEAANLNPTTEDMIKRFGGSTSVEMQWPAEQEGTGTGEADRFERLENMIQKTLKRMTKGSGGGKGSGMGSAGQSGSNSNDNADDDASEESSSHEGGDAG